MDPTNTIQNPAAVFYQVKAQEYSDGRFEPSRVIDEIFVPSSGLIFNSAGGYFKAEKARNKGPSQNISLPQALVDKIDHLAKLKLEVAETEKELVPTIQTFFVESTINAVDFQLMGHISGEVSTLEDLCVVDSSEVWDEMVNSCKLDKLTPKIDFSTKKVIIITQKSISHHEWLVVSKIRKTVSNVLEIECGVLSATTDKSANDKIQSSQFFIIDRDVNYTLIKTVPLKKERIAAFDPELSELDIPLRKYILEKSKQGFYLADKLGWDFLRGLESQELDTTKDKVDEKTFNHVTAYLESLSKVKEIRAQFDHRLSQISDRIRGPNLLA